MLTQGDLVRLVAEAAPAVQGGTLRRIWRAADAPDTFVFLVRLEPPRDGRDEIALEIGLAPEGVRLVAATADDVGAHEPSEKRARKEDALPFLARLRRVLSGCRIEALATVPHDRIALLDLARTGERDPDEPAPQGREATDRPRLAIELTGRATNLVLVDRGPGPELGDAPEIKRDVVIASLRPGRGARPLEAGSRYAPPPPPPPRAESPADFDPEIEPDPRALTLSHLFREACLEAEAQVGERARHQELLKAARRGLARAQGLVTKLEKERDEAQQAEVLRQRGELLKANAGKVKKGMTSVRVTDFFAPEPREIDIELDPLEPVMDQARALFKRAKKLDRGIVAIETRLGAADGEAQDLGKILSDLEAVSFPESPDPAFDALLERAEKQLAKLGCAPRTQTSTADQKSAKKKPEAPSGPRRFASRDGFEILVGRSNEENDRLTIRMARGNDLFFHVRGFPGSHVIVRAQRDKTVPLETLLDASALAVHYSKVRGNTRADVSYTPRKFVRKPRGAKPGLVEISNEKTIRPDGDPARLARLLATAGGREDEGSEELS